MQAFAPAVVAAMMALSIAYPARGADEPTDTVGPRPAEVLRIEGVTLAYPRWMPSGDRIVFQGDQSGQWQIYTAVVDGTEITRLTSGDAASYYPDPSPDGRRIAFVSDRTGNEDVFVMDADGSHVRNITDHPARDIHPYWSPDGRHILFNSTRADPEGFLPHIYEIEADGGPARQLTGGDNYETCARVSPDGEHIVYLQTFVGDDQHDDVCLVDRHGDRVRNLTRDRYRDGWPAWSPDGKRIVFASMRSGTFRLYTMRRDGTGLRQLTAPEAPIADVRPVYSPDGRQVLFNRVLGEDTVAIMRLPLQP